MFKTPPTKEWLKAHENDDVPEVIGVPSERSAAAGENSRAVTGYALVYTPTRLEKLGWKLYPQAHECAPEMAGSQDVLVIKTVAHLSLLDRLRVLASGKIAITTKTTTEGVIGKHLTASFASPEPPSFLQGHTNQDEMPRE